jgi:hypothetical protein
MDIPHKTQEQAYAERAIDLLGGTSATAKLCKISDAAVSQWKENGIPDYRIDFLRLARPSVFDELDREFKTPPSPCRAASPR